MKVLLVFLLSPALHAAPGFNFNSQVAPILEQNCLECHNAKKDEGGLRLRPDTWAVEAVPGENDGLPFECHMQLQTRRGIWNIENLDLSQLVADKAYEFLFVWAPLKMKGATGSPGNPVALY